jgi:hypothetical protein
MKEYLANRLVKIGVALLLLGAGPLLSIVSCAKLGLSSDPVIRKRDRGGC